jgi:hypothetical protein
MALRKDIDLRRSPRSYALPSVQLRDGFVQTTEGLNIPFADGYAALSAVESLNSMARAKNRGARGQYELALADYTDLVGYTTKR